MGTITSIRYLKNNGEFVITTRTVTGKTTKTYANSLSDNEKLWAKSSKYFFEDEYCACWVN